MKKTILTILTLILTVTLGVHVADALGTLTVPANPGTATQYTLNDIYTKLTTGVATSTKSGLFAVPGSVVATFMSLTDIYNAIPGTLTLSASTTTVPVGINNSTTTLDAIDTDLTAANIKSGVNVFGVVGSLSATPATLTWSAEQTPSDWATASSTCVALTEGNVTAGTWRLPTLSELLVAFSDDWVVSGDSSHTGSRFVYGTYYWSSTEYDGSLAWLAGWLNYVDSGYDAKSTTYSVRCVH
jgi:hypothetical protein